MNRRWKPLSHIINDMPLRYKFLLIYLTCVLIPIIFINVLFYIQNSRNTETRERENLQISLDRGGNEISRMINESISIGNTVAADRTINELLDHQYPDLLGYYDVYDSSLRDRLRQYITMYPFIMWMGVFTTNPTIESGNTYFVLKNKDYRNEWYKKMTETKEKVVVTSYLDTNPMNPQQQRVNISIIRKLDSFPDLQSYPKYLRIDLRLDSLLEIFKNERNYMEFKLVDSENRVVLDSNHSYYGEDNLLSPLAKDDWSNVTSGSFASPLSGSAYVSSWQLIGLPDRSRFEQERYAVIRLCIGLMLVSTIIPTILIYIIIHSYNLRVRRLSKHMQLVKNERFEPIDMYEGKDEIGGLLRSFNLMTEKIRNLINDVYKLELQKKDLELERVTAELNYLQSQVDPHFLFNTLNAILVVCKKYRYEHVTEILRNLSQILRRLLSWKEDLVTVEEELSFIEMYLQIEKFRFQDRFHYEMDVDPKTLSCRIPKMSIQQLVENSCKHGLQSVKGERRIQISVRFDDRNLVMVVEDNGIGMTADRRNELLTNIHAKEYTGKNIGLRNVYKRLNLFYNERSLFTIESAEYEGTAITIRIPLALLMNDEEMGENHV